MPSVSKKNNRKIYHKPKWYLDKKVLRPPKQYKWTDADRAILYHLRVEKKMSIASIQRFFKKRDGMRISAESEKYSTIRLYNQIRMARAAMQGLCHRCRKKLSKKDLSRLEKNKRSNLSKDLKLCIKCFENTKEYKEERRREAIKKGICPDCLKRKIQKGKSKCRRCLSWTQRSRNINSLCGTCGEKPISKKSITFCDDCLDKNRSASEKYRKIKKNEKLKSIADSTSGSYKKRL